MPASSPETLSVSPTLNLSVFMGPEGRSCEPMRHAHRCYCTSTMTHWHHPPAWDNTHTNARSLLLCLSSKSMQTHSRLIRVSVHLNKQNCAAFKTGQQAHRCYKKTPPKNKPATSVARLNAFSSATHLRRNPTAKASDINAASTSVQHHLTSVTSTSAADPAVCTD